MNPIQTIQSLLGLINQINKEQPESQWIMEEGTTSRDLIDYALHVVDVDLNCEAEANEQQEIEIEDKYFHASGEPGDPNW